MMFLMFLSFMTIRPKDIFLTLKDFSALVVVLTALKLIVLPLSVYFLFKAFCPDYAAGALLLSGISTGVVAPFICTLVGANGALVLLMVVTSSPLVPLTLPALVKILLAKEIELPFLGMVSNLAMVVFIPIAMVELFRKFIPGFLLTLDKKRYPLSLCCFAFINLGIFSRYSDFFRQKPQIIAEATLAAAVLAILLGIAGIAVMWRRAAPDQIASAISMANINNVLIIVFASQFFGPLEPTLAAMYMIPFFGVIIPMRLYIRANSP